MSLIEWYIGYKWRHRCDMCANKGNRCCENCTYGNQFMSGSYFKMKEK
jgi:hypothetical protein